MQKYKNTTLKNYLDAVSKKQPTPGGGSVAALSGSLAVSLLVMVANYSVGKCRSKTDEKKIGKILKECQAIRKRLLELVDLDAQAYEKVVKTKKSALKVRKAALRQAINVPKEVCKLCYKAIKLTPDLVEKGNKYLVSDVQVAVELLLAAFNSAKINIAVNS